jgi:large subunit ribosomal protein L15
MKGQKARSGGGVRPGFEGGQLPLIRRMARKRGFRNPFRIEYEEVNVGKLARFDAGSEITADTLRAARLAQHALPVKILGFGELSVALTVEASSFSKSAREKIEAAGGTVRWLNGEPAPKEPKARPEPKAKAEAAGVSADAPEKPAKAAKAPKGEADAEAPAQPKQKRAKKEAADAPSEVETGPAVAEKGEADDVAGSE